MHGGETAAYNPDYLRKQEKASIPGGQPTQRRGRGRAGGRGGVHREAAAAGRGQAAGLLGVVWKRVSVPEVRIRAGASAGVCEVAGGLLPGAPHCASIVRYMVKGAEGLIYHREWGLCALSEEWVRGLE